MSLSCRFCVRSMCTAWPSWFLCSRPHRYGLDSFLEAGCLTPTYSTVAMILFLVAEWGQAPCILSSTSFLGFLGTFVHFLHMASVPQNHHVESFLCGGVFLSLPGISPTALLLYHSEYGLRKFSQGCGWLGMGSSPYFECIVVFIISLQSLFSPISTMHFSKV